MKGEPLHTPTAERAETSRYGFEFRCNGSCKIAFGIAGLLSKSIDT